MRFRRLAAAISLALLAASCKPSSSGVLIGVAFPTQNQARWATEEKIIVARAKANGDRVIVQYANESAATQKNQVETLLQRGVQVLILTSINPAAGGDLVKQAQAQGVKVIAYDRFVTGASPDLNIGRDFVKDGEMHADAALKFAPTGDYAMIRGDQSTLAQVEMSRAYDARLKGRPGINIVYDTLIPGWETATAQKQAEAALQKSPNIKAFMVQWDNGAQAVVQALKSAGAKPNTVFVSGNDASTPSLAYIAQGWQTLSVWSPIDEMAEAAAAAAHALGTGKAPPKANAQVAGVATVYVPLISVTRDNLCEFITKIAPKGWVTPREVFGSEPSPCG
jgi:D-xylose transport system substrate-binding protein